MTPSEVCREKRPPFEQCQESTTRVLVSLALCAGRDETGLLSMMRLQPEIANCVRCPNLDMCPVGKGIGAKSRRDADKLREERHRVSEELAAASGKKARRDTWMSKLSDAFERFCSDD